MQGRTDEQVDSMPDLLRSFEALNISMHEFATKEFIHIDEENNEVFRKEILNDVNEVLETMQTTLENAKDESDHIRAKACSSFPESAEDSVNF